MMRTEDDIRAELGRITDEMMKPRIPKYRLAALYSRFEALRWVLGEEQS